MKATYHYYKPSGKLYTIGQGKMPPKEIVHASSREMKLKIIRDANEGRLPGLALEETRFLIVIVPEKDKREPLVFPGQPELKSWRKEPMEIVLAYKEHLQRQLREARRRIANSPATLDDVNNFKVAEGKLDALKSLIEVLNLDYQPPTVSDKEFR